MQHDGHVPRLQNKSWRPQTTDRVIQAEKRGVEDIRQVNRGYFFNWIDLFCIL